MQQESEIAFKFILVPVTFYNIRRQKKTLFIINWQYNSTKENRIKDVREKCPRAVTNQIDKHCFEPNFGSGTSLIMIFVWFVLMRQRLLYCSFSFFVNNFQIFFFYSICMKYNHHLYDIEVEFATPQFCLQYFNQLLYSVQNTFPANILSPVII